jgi:hypothetical protein
VNYYPERNAQDAPVPVTHYQRAGLVPLVQGPTAPVRGIFRASNGQGYAVIGQQVFSISPNWVLTQIGTLGKQATTPVSMTDNGANVLLVDGSQQGYTWSLNANDFSVFGDSSGLFQGADRVDVLDGFIVWNVLGTNQFGSTLEFTLEIDPVYVAAKANYPDPIQSLIVNHHELLLIGQLYSETWYDAGNAGFPFAELAGADHEHGTCAKYSLASADTSTFWLGQTRQGQGVVMRARGYECLRVSNHELEVQFRKYQYASTLLDAIGYCFQQDGHLFYVLNFPTANATWVFDDAMNEWTQWAWTDSNGVLNRHRGNCFAFLNNRPVCGDWQNGTIYQMNPGVFTDTVSINGLFHTYPISFIRSFPHVKTGTMNLGAPGLNRPVEWAGQRMKYNKFVLDLECGNGPRDASGNPALIRLRTSTDRGKTFGEAILQTSGLPGQYQTQPQWLAMGIARDMVFEIEHSIAGEAALNGAWVDAEVLGS